jgi:glycosyltransferase 2 family protein
LKKIRIVAGIAISFLFLYLVYSKISEPNFHAIIADRSNNSHEVQHLKINNKMYIRGLVQSKSREIEFQRIDRLSIQPVESGALLAAVTTLENGVEQLTLDTEAKVTAQKDFKPFAMNLADVSVITITLRDDQPTFAKLIAGLSRIKYQWVILAIIVYFAGIWVRTARWRILLNPLKKCATSRLFPVYIISYMANNILPLRIGDIYRAYIVGKRESISKGASLVTIGVERIFDGLTMLLYLVIAFMFFPVSDDMVKSAITVSAWVFLGAIFVCYLIIGNKRVAFSIFQYVKKFTPVRLHHRADEIFENFFKGLGSLKGIGPILSVIVLSMATWFIEALGYHLVLTAFGFWGHFHVAIATMALVNLLIIVPSAPGYFGPFELACVIILGKSGYGALTHFTMETSAAFALVLHVVVQWIPSTLLGLIYMWSEHITFKEIRDDSESGAAPLQHQIAGGREDLS